MTKKTLVRIVVVIVVMCIMCFSDWSFATEGDNYNIFGYSLNYIVAVLSWIWVLFANLAGTFLTNNWVYGEILGIDTLMWQYWNLMKNIANFGLGFYFVYKIFEGLLSEEGITQKLKKIIVWLLVAGVGIQASWFFVAAVIDVSTITLSAVGSFPAQVIDKDLYIESKLRESLSDYLDPSFNYVEEGTRFKLFSKDGNKSNLIETDKIQLYHPETLSGLVDKLMPSADNVSGPLYYMGLTILKTNVLTSINMDGGKGIKATILNTIIQGGTTIVFSIEMIILCILAIMRIIYLWMFIILSPIAVLLWCIKKSGQNLGDGEKFWNKMYKQINFSSFFINVFKPTIIVLGFGVALLFVILMNGVLVKDDLGKEEVDLGGISATSIPNGDPVTGNEGDKTYTVSMGNDFLGFTLANAGKTFLEMILSIVTVLLVYFIIKFAVQFGGEGKKDFVSDRLGKLQGKVGDLAGSLPVVPVAGYDNEGAPTTHYINASSAFNPNDSNFMVTKKTEFYHGKLREITNEYDEIIDSWPWLGGDKTGRLSEKERTNIQQKIGDTSSGFTERSEGWKYLEQTAKIIKDDIRTKEGKGMTLIGVSESSKFWMSQFERWLNRMQKANGNTSEPIWNKMIDSWGKLEEGERTLEKLFGTADFVKAYAKLFFDDKDERSDIMSWEELKNADISEEESGSEDEEA